MSALAAERNTKRYGDDEVMGFPVKTNVKCYMGGMAVLNAGYAAPATTATGLIALGRFEKTVDNTGQANGFQSIEVRQGTFLWANSASSDQITQADCGNFCYIVDDQTVAKTDGSGTRSKAGKVVGVEGTTGVWVMMGLEVI